MHAYLWRIVTDFYYVCPVIMYQICVCVTVLNILFIRLSFSQQCSKLCLVDLALKEWIDIRPQRLHYYLFYNTSIHSAIKQFRQKKLNCYYAYQMHQTTGDCDVHVLFDTFVIACIFECFLMFVVLTCVLTLTRFGELCITCLFLSSTAQLLWR